MANCNWANLVERGRAKAFGVPWSDAELAAIYELKIPVDFVRGGCLTLEDYHQAQGVVEDGGDKARRYHKKEELVEEAQALGIAFDPEAVTRPDLILLIENAKLSSSEVSRSSSLPEEQTE